jgi:hypothetical protein
MSTRYVRFPMYNAELSGAVTIGNVLLRPTEDHRAQRRRLSSLAHSQTPFWHTADAIVEVNGQPDGDQTVADVAYQQFWHIRGALEFLLQRDLRIAEWYVHHDPDCGDPAEGQGAHAVICNVPYNPAVQVHPAQRSDAIVAAARLWSDEEADLLTGFRYAANLQHASLNRRLPIELQFLSQWIALESLTQRWHEGGRGERAIACAVGAVDRRFGSAVADSLQPYVDGGVITGQEQARMAVEARRSVFTKAWARTRAFLEAAGMGDVCACWLRRCLHIRDGLAHGHCLSNIYADWAETAEPGQDLGWRSKRVNDIVNRYIMSLVGYEPSDWRFEDGSVGWYRRAQRPASIGPDPRPGRPNATGDG